MAKRIQQREQQAQIAREQKQLARARVERQYRRRTMIIGAAIMAVVLTILVVAVVNELVIKPGQPVATVNGVDITTEEFQKQVRFQRSQTLNMAYQYAEMFGVEQVYGILNQLEDTEVMGEGVLDGMIDEVLIRDAAAELGLSVSDEDVSRHLEEQLSFYRDGTPTPAPTNTPRPTATPITDTVATAVPTRTPLPTPTLVTQDAFDEMYQEQLQMFKQDNVDEDTYLTYIQFQLLVDKVREHLMADVPAEADQVQLEVLSFNNVEAGIGEDGTEVSGNEAEALAAEYYQRLGAGEPFEDLVADARAVFTDAVEMTTVAWTPLEELASRYDQDTAELAFSMEVGEYSNVIVTLDSVYLIMQVTGHEVRELSSGTLSTRENNLFTEWLEGIRASAEIEKHDIWHNRVPQDPEIDLARLQPTPTSELLP